jgi:type I restriction enzyme M protein
MKRKGIQMITGEIKNKVDKIWTDIWTGGMTNPLTVVEQLTYLMFIRSLDEKEYENEQMAALTDKPAQRIFPENTMGQSMRWSKFKNLDAREIYDIIATACFRSSRT